jgi:hypothetical protein
MLDALQDRVAAVWGMSGGGLGCRLHGGITLGSDGVYFPRVRLRPPVNALIAVYARRAATVDEERTIREKELAGEKALEEQRRDMIALQGANALQESRNAASARAVAADAEADFQRKRLDVFRDVDPRALLALAVRELADNAGSIGNLTITSDILASLLDGRGPDISPASLWSPSTPTRNGSTVSSYRSPWRWQRRRWRPPWPGRFPCGV